jgi:hypothetical protein
VGGGIVRYSFEGFLNAVKAFLAASKAQVKCARDWCDMPLPRDRVLGGADDSKASWALVSQLVVDENAELRIDGGALCVECAYALRTWIEAKYPENPLKNRERRPVTRITKGESDASTE